MDASCTEPLRSREKPTGNREAAVTSVVLVAQVGFLLRRT
jgi:hypothetical protein